MPLPLWKQTAMKAKITCDQMQPMHTVEVSYINNGDISSKVKKYFCEIWFQNVVFFMRRDFITLHVSWSVHLWSFHTRKRSVWVNRRYLSHAACELHTLPISRRFRETLGFLHFMLKQTTALVKMFQIILSFIKLLFYDIRMLNLE